MNERRSKYLLILPNKTNLALWIVLCTDSFVWDYWFRYVDHPWKRKLLQYRQRLTAPLVRLSTWTGPENSEWIKNFPLEGRMHRDFGMEWNLPLELSSEELKIQPTLSPCLSFPAVARFDSEYPSTRPKNHPQMSDLDLLSSFYATDRN